MSAEAQAMRTLEEISAVMQAARSRFAPSEAEELAKLNTISHCLESVWLSYARSRAFPDAPRDGHAIGCMMRSEDVEVLRDVHTHLFGEIVRVFPHMADAPRAAALLRCFAALIRILEQVDDSTHEEFSSIARALMPAARNSGGSSIQHPQLAAVLFTCVSGSDTILEELYAAGYFTLFLSRLATLARSLPPSIKFSLPADKRASLSAESWAYLELESLLIMCDALSDLVQTSDAVSLLLRSSSSASSAPSSGTSSAVSASTSTAAAAPISASPSSSSAAAAAAAAPLLASEPDALSFCFTLCAFEDRDIACYSVMILQSIVSHPRVSIAFMDRRGPDIILPLALPQPGAAAAHPWTYFTGPFCALMLRFVGWFLGGRPQGSTFLFSDLCAELLRHPRRSTGWPHALTRLAVALCDALLLLLRRLTIRERPSKQLLCL